MSDHGSTKKTDKWLEAGESITVAGAIVEVVSVRGREVRLRVTENGKTREIDLTDGDENG